MKGDDGKWCNGNDSELEDGPAVAEDLEKYEEISQEMAGLGWSDAWRRVEACSRGGQDGRGDGLDESSRQLARKVTFAFCRVTLPVGLFLYITLYETQNITQNSKYPRCLVQV